MKTEKKPPPRAALCIHHKYKAGLSEGPLFFERLNGARMMAANQASKRPIKSHG
jgi:hypothetical protein